MKTNPKSQVKLNPKSRYPYIKRSDTEMIKIVKEIQSGLISNRAACFKYGLYRNTLRLFIIKFSIRNLGDDFSNQILISMNDDQKESILNKKVQQLTKDIEYAELKIVSIETLITVAEDDLKIKIRKKPGTKQLKKYGKCIPIKAWGCFVHCLVLPGKHTMNLRSMKGKPVLPV